MKKISRIEVPPIISDIHNAVLDKKGEDPVLLDLRELTSFTDFFYLVHGWSDRQVRAIQKEIDARLREQKIYPLHQEGEEHGHWILMDYGEVIVHIFHHETRKYYDLEHLWADAATIDLTGLNHTQVSHETKDPGTGTIIDEK